MIFKKVFLILMIFQTSTASTYIVPTKCTGYRPSNFKFECKLAGSFDDEFDPTCTKYFLCERYYYVVHVSTHRICPNGTFFNPNWSQCTSKYVCICDAIKNQADKKTKLTLVTPLKVVEDSLSRCNASENVTEFNCEASGRFPDYSDPSCRKYWFCSKTKNRYKKIPVYCPVGRFYNPVKKMCDKDYNCSCEETSNKHRTLNLEIEGITETTTAAEASSQCSPIEGKEFVCTAEGQYSNDSFCQYYYDCKKLNDGTFKQTKKYCSKGFFFDSLAGICKLNYKRPETTTKRLKTKTLDCNVPETPVEFVCENEGRFENSNDPFCSKYWLCNKLRNETFVKTEYSCPEGSVFDPNLNRCSILYECPCVESTTEVQTTTTIDCNVPEVFKDSECETEGMFNDANDPFCYSYWFCDKLKNGSYVKTGHSCAEGSSFDPYLNICSSSYECPCTKSSTASTTETTTTIAAGDCIVPEQSVDFECEAKGRYKDANDPFCYNYWLCNKLNNGSYIKTSFSCPEGSSFDPKLNICSIFYKCPCISPSTTAISTTISENCNVPEKLVDFECEAEGRFEDVNDPFCYNYWLCNKLRNGTFIKTPYSCPEGSSFDSNSNVCSIIYECPCTKPTTITDVTETTTTTPVDCTIPDVQVEFECEAKGRFKDVNDPFCYKYWLCNKLNNGSYIKTGYSCPDGSSFDPNLKVCSTSYKCPCIKPSTISTTEITTTTSEDCKVPGELVDFECEAEGRFVDVNDPFCYNYWLCNKLRNGTFIKTPYSCPEGSSFDPKYNVCSIIYECPCTKPTATTTEVTATTTTTPVDCTIPDVQVQFECEAKGRFKDVNDPFCYKYWLCNKLNNGSYIKTEYSCPDGTSFDPNSGVCSFFYECPCIKPSTTTTTPEDCSPPEVQVDFECQAEGRFEDANDPFCYNYWLCNKLRNGTFIKTPYSCPEGSSFDPKYNVCSIIYECPCIKPTATTTEVTITTTTTPVDCTIPDVQVQFECEAKGRFKDVNDPFCYKYWLCNKLNNGSYIKTEYSCPDGTSFDPNSGVCSFFYECACTKPSTTTTTPEDCTPPEVEVGFECQAEGRFEDVNDPFCYNYWLCNKLRNGTFIKTAYSCPEGSSFDPKYNVCSIIYECPCIKPTATTTEVTITTAATPIDCSKSQEYVEFSCLDEGRFADANDRNCLNYWLCSKQEDNTYLKVHFTCPENTTFDPTLKMCTKNYQCSCREVETTTEKECFWKTEDFECTESGRFVDRTDPSCTKYWLCGQLKDGSFQKISYTCPEGTYFHRTLKNCNANYSCTCEHLDATTELIATTTEDRCDAAKEVVDFECSVMGRFADLSDVYCKKYWFCGGTEDGSLKKISFACPDNSYFDPELSSCNVGYNCACKPPPAS